MHPLSHLHATKIGPHLPTHRPDILAESYGLPAPSGLTVTIPVHRPVLTGMPATGTQDPPESRLPHGVRAPWPSPRPQSRTLGWRARGRRGAAAGHRGGVALTIAGEPRHSLASHWPRRPGERRSRVWITPSQGPTGPPIQMTEGYLETETINFSANPQILRCIIEIEFYNFCLT
jgi:hypothetical protein